jgi:hypothetical protein
VKGDLCSVFSFAPQIRFLIPIEEPRDQCIVVFALIVTKPACD